MSRHFIDLHTHSAASDGTDSPADLVRLAARQGLAALAVTDHDTVSGLGEAAHAAQTFGIECIRACEFTAWAPVYTPIHIVGLWIPEDNSTLAPLLVNQQERRAQRNRLMLEQLAGLGIFISEAELEQAGRGDGRGRPHMARILVERGITATIDEAFARFLGDNAPGYVPMIVPGPEEIITCLAAAGATPVLAHPLQANAPREWLEDTLSSYKARGLDAIEAYHANHSPAQTRYCVDVAQRLGLALSGGSDYHGAARPGLRLGTGWGGLRVPLFVLERLKELRTRKGLPV